MQRLWIRTDIGGTHGMGHAIRCKALAQVLAQQEVHVQFLTSTPALAAFVAPFPCASLGGTDICPPPPPGPLAGLVVDTKAPDWCTDNAWLTQHRARGRRIVRLDHPGATPDSCDLLILPNAHQAPNTLTRLQQGFGGRLRWGWDYVMLDAEVTGQAPLSYGDRQHGQVVFCAGGSDPAGCLAQMIAWAGALPKTMDCLFLLPQHAMTVYGVPEWITCESFTREALRRAALVVSMFGQTCYEALWYQTPLLMLSHTDENDWDAFYLAQASQGAARRLGPLAAQIQETFCTAIHHLWDAPRTRVQMHSASAGLMDGHGVQRVADAILALL